MHICTGAGIYIYICICMYAYVYMVTRGFLRFFMDAYTLRIMYMYMCIYNVSEAACECLECRCWSVSSRLGVVLDGAFGTYRYRSSATINLS